MLTQDEAALYDRQIRLWGVNAQSRLRQSKILMLGFNGIASEVAKTLVLAGVKTLTIVDYEPLQKTDSGSNLFCRPGPEPSKFRTHATEAKLKALNPLVKVIVENTPIPAKEPEFFTNFDLVTIHTFLEIEKLCEINEICRRNNVKFYLTLDFGFHGFMFSDLGQAFKFTYEDFVDYDKTKTSENDSRKELSTGDAPLADIGDVVEDTSGDEERPKKKLKVGSPPKESNTGTEGDKQTKVRALNFVSFKEMISLQKTQFSKRSNPVALIAISLIHFYDQRKKLPLLEDGALNTDDLSLLKQIFEDSKAKCKFPEAALKNLSTDWFQEINGSVGPVCAVVGGVAGQDMIRAISNKDIPIYNIFLFDGISMIGSMEQIGISDANKPSAQPVVRDFLEIDDDDEDDNDDEV